MISISRMRPVLVFLFPAGMHGVAQAYVFLLLNIARGQTTGSYIEHPVRQDYCNPVLCP